MPNSNGKKNILVVDNDESMRYMLQTKLFQMGFLVTVAGGGAHALQIFQTGKAFDLIICELKMPIKDGIEILKYMRANFLQLPVIMMSNSPDRDRIIAAAQLGVSDILVKPIRQAELVKLVKAKLSLTDAQDPGSQQAA